MLAVGSAASAQDVSGSAAGGQQAGLNGAGGASKTSGDDAALKKTLQDTYDKCATATKKRDESVLANVRTRDFTYKEANGKAYTRDQVETAERQALNEIQNVDSVSSQVDSVKAEGGKVTATVRQSFAGTVTDTQNKAHKMTIATMTRDVWTQGSGGWKLQSVQVVGRQETRDGKPFDPNAAQSSNSNKQNANNRNTGYNGYNGGYRAPSYHMPHLSVPKTSAASRKIKKL